MIARAATAAARLTPVIGPFIGAVASYLSLNWLIILS